MADYQLTAPEEPCTILRSRDNASIPPDMANRDYNGDAMQPGYIQWKEAGGTPDPYVPPPEPEPAPPTAEQQILFDHENRIRTQEGVPPLTLDEFQNMLRNPTAAAAPKKKAPAPPPDNSPKPPPPRRK